MKNSFELKPHSVFVADSHFNFKRRELLDFLDFVLDSNFAQVFFMGDIFDFLSQESKYFIRQNSTAIKKINQIAECVEVYYFEGNHDYNLKNLFPKVKIIPRNLQPVIFENGKHKIALLHGDAFVGFGYDLFCQIIRNKELFSFLNLIDFGFVISKKIENFLSQKVICRQFEFSSQWLEDRFIQIDSEIIAEGHYHQNYQTVLNRFKYVNFPSLACTNEYSYFDGAQFQSIKLSLN